MLKGMLGKKLGMTRLFTEQGHWIPVTLLETGPCSVVQRKTELRDGYEAVQLGFGERREKCCTKPERGHFKKAGVTPKRHVVEFPVDPADEFKLGDLVRVDLFAVGERVDVSGVTKGRGFAGVHRRHKFGGGPGGHGSNFHRRPGSIGQSADPSKVFKGLRMPGHMGAARVTTQNLEIVKVDAEKNLLVIRGCIPGATGGIVEVKKSVKGAK